MFCMHFYCTAVLSSSFFTEMCIAFCLQNKGN